jgi:hypothetical protein
MHIKLKYHVNNVYFETHPRAIVKKLWWHNNLTLMDVKLSHKLNKRNCGTQYIKSQRKLSNGDVLKDNSNSLHNLCQDENNFKNQIMER